MPIKNRLITSATPANECLVHGDGVTTYEYINDGATIELVHLHGGVEVKTPLTAPTEQHKIARGSLLKVTPGAGRVSILAIEG